MPMAVRGFQRSSASVGEEAEEGGDLGWALGGVGRRALVEDVDGALGERSAIAA
jgi:hypothetical protein